MPTRKFTRIRTSKEKKEFAAKMRRNPTPAEACLAKALRVSGMMFSAQHPIKGYIADFFFPKAALVVEVDGGIHDAPRNRLYDATRDCALRSSGIAVIHFTNEEAIYATDITVKHIRELFHDLRRKHKKNAIFARRLARTGNKITGLDLAWIRRCNARPALKVNLNLKPRRIPGAKTE